MRNVINNENLLLFGRGEEKEIIHINFYISNIKSYKFKVQDIYCMVKLFFKYCKKMH